jgi:hypothetical protein
MQNWTFEVTVIRGFLCNPTLRAGLSLAVSCFVPDLSTCGDYIHFGFDEVIQTACYEYTHGEY